MAQRADRARISQKPLPANARRIPIPAAALGPWLAEIEDAAELRVSLRAVAILAEGSNRRGVPPSLVLEDLLDDPFLVHAHGVDGVRSGLGAALARGTLLAARASGEVRIFLNDDAGRRYFEQASLTPLDGSEILAPPTESAPIHRPPPEQPDPPRANIFALYEEHIGQFGHSVAEQLKAAEAEYPINWIEDAFAVAKERKALNWNYVQGILRRWLNEGRHSGADIHTGQRRDQYDEHGKPGDDTAPDSRTGYLESYRRRHGRLPWESGEPTSG